MTTAFDPALRPLCRLGAAVESFIQQDPGNRGLADWAQTGDLFPAAVSLAGARHVAITTGFYILSGGAIETDGPPGTAVLARTLERAGVRVTVVTDNHAERIVQSALSSVGSGAALVTGRPGEPIPLDRVVEHDTTHLIALERPGVAADGLHHNFRGLAISGHVASTDGVFAAADQAGLTTIGIGDGGNELGMGNVSEAVDRHVSPGRAYSCQTRSRFCLCAGISNWAGYALSALLSVLHGRPFMPEPALLAPLLDGIVREGAVDGVTGQRVSTVDGQPFGVEARIYQGLFAATVGGDAGATCIGRPDAE